LIAILGLAVLAGSSAGRSGPLPHEAYIWQRRWTSAVADAVRDSADLVGAWRVLVAQAEAAGPLRTISVDWRAFRESGRPVVAVVRIEGQLRSFDSPALRGEIRSLLAKLAEAGAVLAGIEIDHDCGTARLPAYAEFLENLRAETGGLPLSITALPSWMSSPALDAVVATVDEVILQVHAVDAPSRGMFDPGQAETWARTFARRSSKPFRLALPAYGMRVSFTPTGEPVAVESEAPLLAGTGNALELMAPPQEVAGLMRALEARTPPRLLGFTWFRLPTADDRRAWTPPTWRAVLQREPLLGSPMLERRPTQDPALSDLVLVNAGSVDVPLPRSLTPPRADCHLDGVNGYSSGETGSGPVLEVTGPGMLRAGRERVVGWMRCDAAGG
jgi:hypothetical protein